MRPLPILLTLAPVLCMAQQPLSLAEAIQRAREHSPAVQSARAEVEAAAQGVRIARAGLAPQLSANGFYASSKPGAILRSAPGVMPDALMGMPAGDTGVTNLMLMVPLFTGGTLQARVAKANAQVRAALGELAEMQAEAGLMAEEGYLMALLASANIAAQEARVDAAEEMVRTARARLEAGKDILASVQRADAELAMARRELLMAKNEREKALIDIQLAMGSRMDTPLSLSGDLKALAVEGSLTEFVERSQTNRGRVIAVEARVEAARQDARAVAGTFGPQVYAQAMADTSNDSMMRGGTLGIVASLSLFDGGERRADLARMRAMQALAGAQLLAEKLVAEKEVRQSWLDLETASENARSAQSSVESAEAAHEVVRLRVEAGKGILLEQLDALQVLVQARSDLARATYDQRVARARLYRAAGTQTPEGSSS